MSAVTPWNQFEWEVAVIESEQANAFQLNWLRTGSGVGVVHDFALPAAPDVTRILTESIHLTRSFWLIRHESDTRLDRLNRFADQLTREARAEMARLEGALRADESRL